MYGILHYVSYFIPCRRISVTEFILQDILSDRTIVANDDYLEEMVPLLVLL